MDELSINLQQCRFYLVTDNNGYINIIKTQNSDTALKLVTKITSNREIKPLSDQEAFQLILNGDSIDGHDKVEFLQQHPEFVGVAAVFK